MKNILKVGNRTKNIPTKKKAYLKGKKLGIFADPDPDPEPQH
jgi:hypothetical protein